MEQQALWDYYQTDGTACFSAAYPRLKFLCSKTKKGKALDIGVGDGLLLELLDKSGIDAYGLDPSEVTVNALKEKTKKQNQIKTGYIQDLPFEDNFFDTVIITEVIEHLNEDHMKKGLMEINRVLKPSGTVLITVPAREDLEENMVVCPCGKIFHRWGHVQSFTIQRLQEILSSDFDVLQCREKLFVAWGTLNWKGKIGNFLRCVLYGTGVPINNAKIFCCARKSGHGL